MWFGYFSAAKKLNEKQAIAISSRYFTFGLGMERKALVLNGSFIKATNNSPNDQTFQVFLICSFGSKKENL